MVRKIILGFFVTAGLSACGGGTSNEPVTTYSSDEDTGDTDTESGDNYDPFANSGGGGGGGGGGGTTEDASSSTGTVPEGGPCRENAECQSGLYCSNGKCKSSGTSNEDGSITGCRTSVDCAGNPATPYCHLSSGQCVECLVDAHCVDQKICENNLCVDESGAGDAAVSDAEEGESESGTPDYGTTDTGNNDTGSSTNCNPACDEPTPYCVNGYCKSCMDTGCTVGHCNASTGRCTTQDGGVTDAGGTDSGTTDAGTDAGTTDTGTDAGSDAGLTDAGTPDVGVYTCTPPCDYGYACQSNKTCKTCRDIGCATGQTCNPTTGYCDYKLLAQSCKSDTDCRIDEYCFLSQRPTPNDPPVLTCANRRVYLGKGGTSCKDDYECDSFYCYDDHNYKYCFGPCATNMQCANSFRCGTMDLYGNQLKACIPNDTPCAITADCPEGWVCTIGKNQFDMDAFLCKAPVGTVQGGGPCEKNEDCEGNICISYDFCYVTRKKCISDTECSAGEKCTSGSAGDYCFEPCRTNSDCENYSSDCKGYYEISSIPATSTSCAIRDYFPP